MKYGNIKAVVMDMDGVLWRGEQALNGLQEMFVWLHEQSIPYMLATNNSSKTPADYMAKLARLEVRGVTEARILTSGIATATYMQSRFAPGTRVFVVGGKGVRQALDEAGFDVQDDSADKIEVVVVGIDFDLNYDKLRTATLAIRNGAEFIGTNPDVTYPTPEGLAPGAGSVIAMVEVAVDQKAMIIGKPFPAMFQTALSTLGVSAENALMIGDRLNTDISGGQGVGMKTALLFSGVTTPEMLTTSDIWSDVAYEDLAELVKAWAGHDWYREQLKAKRAR